MRSQPHLWKLPSLKSQPHNWEVSPTKSDQYHRGGGGKGTANDSNSEANSDRNPMCSHHWWSPKPWEEFSFSRDSCQTPLNSPPLRRLKFFTWDICISLIFLLNCHVELFRKPHHDNHIDSYFECTRQKQSFLEQVFGYLWQRWNFKGNFELSININAGLCVLTIPQEKS